VTFNSYGYLSLLLVVVPLYWMVPAARRRWFALALSVAYYASWQPLFALLPLALAVWTWWIVRAMETEPARSKAWVRAGITGLVGLLAFFKYREFLWANAVALWNGREGQTLLAIGLPLGISFLTFDAIAVLLDARQKRVRRPSVWDLWQLFGFWPSLLSGPIVRFREMVPQWTSPKKWDRSALIGGLDRLIVGLVQKNFIANSLGAVVDEGFLPKAALTNTTLDNWVLAIAYGLQIYFDFAAYTNMAIGSARLLGLNLPGNFRYPYHASSPPDFWSRWHMSLSRWIRDYLFFPINAKYGGRPLPLYISLVAIMSLVGLWHGAGWGFLVWGGLHGVYLVVYRMWESFAQSRGGWTKSAWTKLIWRGATLAAVAIAWVPFRAATLEQSAGMLKHMFLPNGFAASYGVNALLITASALVYCALEPFLAAWLQRAEQRIIAWPGGQLWSWLVVRPAFYAALLLLFVAFDERNARFIYFQF